MPVSGRHPVVWTTQRDRRISCVASVITLLILGLTVAGCAEVSEFPAFDRAPTAVDKLPSTFDNVETSQFDADDIRFAGRYKGTDLYLMRQDTGMCIGVSTDGTAAYGCGDIGLEFTHGGGVEAQLVYAPAIATEGWTTIGDNIRVRD